MVMDMDQRGSEGFVKIAAFHCDSLWRVRRQEVQQSLATNRSVPFVHLLSRSLSSHSSS